MLEFFSNVQAAMRSTMPLVLAFVTAIAVDITLGLMAAFASKTANSAVSRVGMMRKFGQLAIVLLCLVADGLFPQLITFRGNSMTVASFACVVWLVYEALSIVENAALLGIPVPRWVRDRLEQVRKQLDEDIS